MSAVGITVNVCCSVQSTNRLDVVGERSIGQAAREFGR